MLFGTCSSLSPSPFGVVMDLFADSIVKGLKPSVSLQFRLRY